MAGLTACHLAQERYDAAIAAAGKALASCPDLTHAQFTLPAALSATGSPDEELPLYDRLLVGQPNHARAGLNRGNLHLDRDAKDKAEADLRAANRLPESLSWCGWNKASATRPCSPASCPFWRHRRIV